VFILIFFATASPSLSRRTLYKETTAKKNARDFVSVIAHRLYGLYECGQEKLVGLKIHSFVVEKAKHGVTFGDVLFARKTGSATPRQEGLSELHDFFSKDDWNYLKDLNIYANPHQHINKLPRRLVLPHDFFDPDRVQAIALAAGAISDRNDLELTDEEHVSSPSKASNTV
jgi:hypothetical protein